MSADVTIISCVKFINAPAYLFAIKNYNKVCQLGQNATQGAIANSTSSDL